MLTSNRIQELNQWIIRRNIFARKYQAKKKKKSFAQGLLQSLNKSKEESDQLLYWK